MKNVEATIWREIIIECSFSLRGISWYPLWETQMSVRTSFCSPLIIKFTVAYVMRRRQFQTILRNFFPRMPECSAKTASTHEQSSLHQRVHFPKGTCF